MRGKELECRCVRLPERITPAYAGKSHKVRLQAAGRWDHPRVCGEKRCRRQKEWCGVGSPPRMRGKGFGFWNNDHLVGITPAYAGKRISLLITQTHPGDHPRVCGEKQVKVVEYHNKRGSPPRMRGKELSPAPTGQSPRITPAYAGKRGVLLDQHLG